MYKLLIVEDDETIAGAVAKHLEGWGYHCVCATDFAHVTREFAAHTPACAAGHLPALLQRVLLVRRNSQALLGAHFVFVFCRRQHEPCHGHQHGGDDFLAKPFDFDVLVAKVQALLRRTYDFSAGASLVEHRGVILNLSDASVTCHGEKLELSKNEYRILQVLFERRGRVVARETLMQRLWETDLFVDENTLTVNIARLRRKLEAKGVRDLIVTKKGLGYMVE